MLLRGGADGALFIMVGRKRGSRPGFIAQGHKIRESNSITAALGGSSANRQNYQYRFAPVLLLRYDILLVYL